MASREKHARSGSTRRVWAFLPWVVGACVASACSWGNYSAPTNTDAGVGAACDGILPTCARDLRCVSLACRASCTSDSSCPGDQRCLFVSLSDAGQNNGGGQTTGPFAGVCVDHASMECTQNCQNDCPCPGPTCGFCPNGSACASDGQCRTSCVVQNQQGTQTSVGCTADQECVTALGPTVCVGLPPHDTGAGRDGGTGTP